MEAARAARAAAAKRSEPLLTPIDDGKGPKNQSLEWSERNMKQGMYTTVTCWLTTAYCSHSLFAHTLLYQIVTVIGLTNFSARFSLALLPFVCYQKLFLLRRETLQFNSFAYDFFPVHIWLHLFHRRVACTRGRRTDEAKNTTCTAPSHKQRSERQNSQEN